MNTSQTYHDEQIRSARDGPGPVREHPARLVPSSRYRHPGDVIRLIAGGLLLIVALAAVALAPGQLVGTDASAVTWLGADPAGRQDRSAAIVGVLSMLAGLLVAVAWRNLAPMVQGVVSISVTHQFLSSTARSTCSRWNCFLSSPDRSRSRRGEAP